MLHTDAGIPYLHNPLKVRLVVLITFVLPDCANTDAKSRGYEVAGT